jgi:hypothetical protein
MDGELGDLMEQLRFAMELYEDDPKVTAQRANVFASKAARKGDRKALAYWRSVLANAQSRLRSAAGEPAQTHGHEEPPEDDKKPKVSFKDRIKNVGKAAVAGAKSAATGALQGLKNIPAASRKFVTDADFRKETGKKAAASLKRGVAKAVLHACEEVGEVIEAGAVVGKAASGKKLTKHDKHVLKAGAKALATTLVGTIALGGIAHLTATALAQHFAIETAAKSIGKAALYADLTTEADEKAGLKMWAEHIANGVVKGFSNLGSMSEDKLAEILRDSHS